MEEQPATNRWAAAELAARRTFPPLHERAYKRRAWVLTAGYCGFIVVAGGFVLLSAAVTGPQASLVVAAVGALVGILSAGWAAATGRLAAWTEPLDPLPPEERSALLKQVFGQVELDPRRSGLVRAVAERARFCGPARILMDFGMLLMFLALILSDSTVLLRVLFYVASIAVLLIATLEIRRTLNAARFLRNTA
ncbi:hypothetical protein [Agromyces sp. Root81]|uniref:hypothetical protein n=1 Tax=Agromyces sp. Root81 TaxID=1736601 RepID=UPI0012F71DFB|nr:hypothetical protein [Agromyces sp. Root81]